jgi:enoyl-CoA hydratase/carnithine racemase
MRRAQDTEAGGKSMSDVLTEKRGAALWLTINRPEQRNALTREVLAALTGALREAKEDPALRVVVLTGAGDKAFCAGADLKDASTKDGNPFQAPPGVIDNALATFYAEVERCTLPLVARVNGHAMGGGLGLVAACDLAVAADHALFATPEVKVGVYPMLITAYLMRLVPRRRLAEMSLLGEPLTAAQAAGYGLINSAVPRAELDAKVDTMVAALVERSPTAIRLGKHALHAVQDMTLPQCLEYMTLMIDRLAQTEDAREGFAAFTGKRRPAWTGR